MFYKAVNALSDIKLENGISDFRLLDRRVVDELKQINEYEIFFRGMVKWVGFKQKGIPYTPAERHTGEASYSFFRLFKLAVGGIMAFSVRRDIFSDAVCCTITAGSVMICCSIL